MFEINNQEMMRRVVCAHDFRLKLILVKVKPQHYMGKEKVLMGLIFLY